MINFNYQAPFKLSQSGRIKSSIQQLIEQEGFELQHLRYIFCTDEYLLTINQQFLNHDDYTDIITFDLSETAGVIEGEIYISIDRVKENAATFKAPIQTEILRVVYHGALHLCGYGDKTPTQTKVMRSKEDHYIDLFKRST